MFLKNLNTLTFGKSKALMYILIQQIFIDGLLCSRHLNYL